MGSLRLFSPCGPVILSVFSVASCAQNVRNLNNRQKYLFYSKNPESHYKLRARFFFSGPYFFS